MSGPNGKGSAGTGPLRLLHLGSAEADFARVRNELTRHGLELEARWVADRTGLEAALGSPWDAVTAWLGQGAPDPLDAVRALRGKQPHLPLVVVCDAVGEERVAELMREGAQDVVQDTALARLGPAVRRARDGAEARAGARTARDDLAVSDRLAVVGTVAASLAAELGDPLAAVLANVESMALEAAVISQEATGFEAPPGVDPAHAWRSWLSSRLARLGEPTRDARAAARLARQVVRDVRAFSRTAPSERRTAASVEAALDAAIRLSWSEVGGRARLVKQYGSVRAVWGQLAPLAQLFFELLVNAAQAIPPGRVDSNVVSARTRDEGDAVAVEIEDTGQGVPPDVFARLFTPGVSTRPRGEGSGMGLVVCRRIAESLGGSVTVRTVVGRGTVVRVVLPVADKDALVESVATPAPFGAPRARRGRLLVVDDQELIARAVARCFERDHDVVVARTMKTALDAVQAGPPFGAVLCDMLLPDATGIELYAQLSRDFPEQASRIVFMTGGASSPGIRDFLLGVTNAHIEKPFELQNLRLLVQGLLAQ